MICQINAEVLSALVLFQTVHPGWPVIYGVASGMADPITGEYVKSGEAALVSLEAWRWRGITGFLAR